MRWRDGQRVRTSWSSGIRQGANLGRARSSKARTARAPTRSARVGFDGKVVIEALPTRAR